MVSSTHEIFNAPTRRKTKKKTKKTQKTKKEKDSKGADKKQEIAAARLLSPEKNSGSDSSATIVGQTSRLSALADPKYPPFPPDPTLKLNNRGNPIAAGPKQPGERFSRIAADTRVDPKFASNAFNAHDWGQKAHEDLIVTKGRGFTKEKNKKKRGSYRGGFIDTNARNGIKFDD